MAANAINNFFGAHSQGLGLGAFGGLGIAGSTKPPLMERYHDEHQHQHHGWQKSSKGGNKKGNVALSALTLLAFLFFLHILQNCIQDHMHEMKAQHYKGNQGIRNFSNILVIDSGGSSSNTIFGRENLKGDDGLLPESEEDLALDQWPIKAHKEQKEAQRRVLKPRHKKNQSQSQQKQKHGAGAGKHRNGQVTPVGVKNSIPGFPYPVEPEELDMPMHRIDNIP